MLFINDQAAIRGRPAKFEADSPFLQKLEPTEPGRLPLFQLQLAQGHSNSPSSNGRGSMRLQDQPVRDYVGGRKSGGTAKARKGSPLVFECKQRPGLTLAVPEKAAENSSLPWVGRLGPAHAKGPQSRTRFSKPEFQRGAGLTLVYQVFT